MDAADVLHVEICQKIDSTLPKEEIEELAHSKISSLKEISLNSVLDHEELLDGAMNEHVESIICSSSRGDKDFMEIRNADIKFYTYRLNQEEAGTETMQNDQEELPVSSHWILPAKEFYYLWETLYFDSNIKEDLLSYVETSMTFANHNVNPHIITWNKVVLLHGPPGTGKTSMCKALAQKLSIRLGHQFTHGELVEINSHSLFSKWFSESGKLVMKLFNEIKSLLENPHALVCILIDEIESLAHIRKSCSSGTEPTDSIRVVNALLTQLDQIKRYPNVLILTTSNLTEAIDLAFVDRADIKQYVGPPTHRAVYKIYHSCIKELIRANLVEQEKTYDLEYLESKQFMKCADTENSRKLWTLSAHSEGLSGRSLRKVPFLTHALYLHTEKSSLCRFLQAMSLAIDRVKEEGWEI